MAIVEYSIPGNKRLIIVTDTEANVAAAMGAGTGLSNAKYRWNGDPKNMVIDTGATGALIAGWVSTAT